MAGERAERGVDQGGPEDVFPTRGCEEVGACGTGGGWKTEYCGKVAKRGGSSQGRSWETHCGVRVVLG